MIRMKSHQLFRIDYDINMCQINYYWNEIAVKNNHTMYAGI